MPQMPNISATSSGMGRVMQRAIKLLMRVTFGLAAGWKQWPESVSGNDHLSILV
jgi:hypothetical protein